MVRRRSVGAGGDVRSAGGLYGALERVGLDDDPVLAELLLDEDDLFGALDDKVAAGIEGTLVHASELGVGLAGEDALAAAKHDGETADVDVWTTDDGLGAGVLDGDEDGGAVGDVAETTLVGGDGLVDGIEVGAVGEGDVDVGVLEPEAGVDVGGDLVVGLDDVLDVDVDEMVERVDVLLDEALDLEKGGEEEPFVLARGER